MGFRSLLCVRTKPCLNTIIINILCLPHYNVVICLPVWENSSAISSPEVPNISAISQLIILCCCFIWSPVGSFCCKHYFRRKVDAIKFYKQFFSKGSNPPKSGFVQKSHEESALQMYMLVELAGFNQRSTKLLFDWKRNYYQDSKSDSHQLWTVLGPCLFPSVLPKLIWWVSLQNRLKCGNSRKRKCCGFLVETSEVSFIFDKPNSRVCAALMVPQSWAHLGTFSSDTISRDLLVLHCLLRSHLSHSRHFALSCMFLSLSVEDNWVSALWKVVQVGRARCGCGRVEKPFPLWWQWWWEGDTADLRSLRDTGWTRGMFWETLCKAAEIKLGKTRDQRQGPPEQPGFKTWSSWEAAIITDLFHSFCEQHFHLHAWSDLPLRQNK